MVSQSEHVELRQKILLQSFDEDTDEGKGKRRFNPSHVLLSLAASAQKGEGWRRAPNNERVRTLEILGLYGPMNIHDCVDHGSYIAPPLMNAKFGVVDVMSIHRAPGDSKGVATLVAELNKVHVDVNEDTVMAGKDSVDDESEERAMYMARHLSSCYIPCPKCLFEKATGDESTAAVSCPAQLARYSPMYSHYPRECVFLLVGSPDGTSSVGTTSTPMPHKLSLFSELYVLRAVVYNTSGGHQFTAQVYLRGCWRLYNDMNQSGRLVHAHTFDTEFDSGSEYMLMYVREDLVTRGNSRTEPSQRVSSEAVPQATPTSHDPRHHAEARTASSQHSQPGGGARPLHLHSASGVDSKQVGATRSKPQTWCRAFPCVARRCDRDRPGLLSHT